MIFIGSWYERSLEKERRGAKDSPERLTAGTCTYVASWKPSNDLRDTMRAKEGLPSS
jgi:hypothetical protein